MPIGNEPIRKDGEIIGRVKSGGQGYTINKAIGYAYLPIEHTSVGTMLDVEFFGKWQTGTVSASPLFDPDSSRIKA